LLPGTIDLIFILLILNNKHGFETLKLYPRGVGGGVGVLIFWQMRRLGGVEKGSALTGMEVAYGMIVRCLAVIFGKG
jgi:hypothetical protein